MSNDSQAELLPPEEKTPQDFPLLRIATPMEAMAEFLDAIVKDHESAIVWADKCVIDSPASRDEARMARKELKATIAAIEAKRLLALKPLDNFRDDFLALCREKCQKMEDAIAVYDDKGVAYNTECKRIEAEEKARAQAAILPDRWSYYVRSQVCGDSVILRQGDDEFNRGRDTIGGGMPQQPEPNSL